MTDAAAPPATAPAAAPPAKKLPPLLKLVLELGPVLLFFFAFQWLNDPEAGFDETRALIWATGIFMAALAISMAVSWALTRTITRIAIFTGVLVAVMGGLTIALESETFIKLKPTVVNAAFAVILGVGLLQGRSYLKYLIEDMVPMTDEGWLKMTRNWAVFFAFLAVFNEVLWRGFSTETWVTVDTFAVPAMLIVFVFSQAFVIAKYTIEDDAGDGGETSAPETRESAN